MLGSNVLDIAIGLVFVYLVFSLIVTAASELLAGALSWRADNLRKGLERLLGPALAHALYDHPLISKLSKGSRGPSYIPARTFALALVDTLPNLGAAHAVGAQTLTGLIDNIPDADVRRVLALLLDEAGTDGAKLNKNIEDWFNSSMDRVAGWYKRKTQIANVILAVAVVVVVNVDSLLIVTRLGNDAALRAALVAQAQELAKQAPPAAAGQPAGAPQPGTEPKAALDEIDKRIGRLSALGLPVGWTDTSDAGRPWPGWHPAGKPFAEWGGQWLGLVRQHLLGWLLTALAASLGAPFWFDILKKIITIRSAGPVPDSPKAR